jgi:hypothetical protein
VLRIMNAKKQAASANFNFLSRRYPELDRIGAQSERYFSDDPIISLITIRQFGEVLAQLVAGRPHSGRLVTGIVIVAVTDATRPQCGLCSRSR